MPLLLAASAKRAAGQSSGAQLADSLALVRRMSQAWASSSVGDSSSHQQDDKGKGKDNDEWQTMQQAAQAVQAVLEQGMLLMGGSVFEGLQLLPSHDSQLEMVGACPAGSDSGGSLLLLTAGTSSVLHGSNPSMSESVHPLNVVPMLDLRGTDYAEYVADESDKGGTGDGPTVAGTAVEDSITAVLPMTCGKRVLLGSHKGRVLVLQADTGRPQTEYRPHNAEVSSIAECPEDGVFVTGSWDGSWRVYCDPALLGAAIEGGATTLDGGTGTDIPLPIADAVLAREVRGAHGGKAVTAVAVSHRASIVLTAGADGYVRAWDF